MEKEVTVGNGLKSRKSVNELIWRQTEDPPSLNHLNNSSKSQGDIIHDGTNLIILAEIFSWRFGFLLMDNPALEIHVCYLGNEGKGCFCIRADVLELSGGLIVMQMGFSSHIYTQHLMDFSAMLSQFVDFVSFRVSSGLKSQNLICKLCYSHTIYKVSVH